MIFKYFFQVNLVGISKDKHYYFMTIFHFTFFFFLTEVLLLFLRIKHSKFPI